MMPNQKIVCSFVCVVVFFLAAGFLSGFLAGSHGIKEKQPSERGASFGFAANAETYCRETDGGDNPSLKGNAYGKLNGIFYNNTDRCVNPTRQREYYCVRNKKKESYNNCNCLNGSCMPSSCNDTDRGHYIYAKGEIFINGTFVAEDYCLGDISDLREFYCLTNESVASNDTYCPAGFVCSSGRCVESYNCEETDSGYDLLTSGDITAYGQDDLPLLTLSDHCYDGKRIKEYYCGLDGPYVNITDCPNGYNCSLGRCLILSCADTDGGYNIFTKGAVTNQNNATRADYCGDGSEKLIEYYCAQDHTIMYNITHCPETFYCLNGSCNFNFSEVHCTDTDFGNNSFASGFAYGYVPNGSFSNLSDSCTLQGLLEAVCNPFPEYTLNNCPDKYFCDYDLCVNATEISCTDSDGGNDPLLPGYAYGFASNGTLVNLSDYCDPSLNVQHEATCVYDNPLYTANHCLEGYYCSMGFCALNSSKLCYDSDPQNDVYTKGYTVIPEGFYPDVCDINGLVLYQKYCDFGDMEEVSYSCTDCCIFGRCCMEGDISEYNIGDDNTMIVFVAKRVVAADGVFELSDFAVEGIKETLDSMQSFYNLWSEGMLHMNIGVVILNEIEISRPYTELVVDEVPEVIRSRYATKNIDFYGIISAGGNGGGSWGADYGVYGAGQFSAIVNDYCFTEDGSIVVNGDRVCEPIIHEPLHIADIALRDIMGIDDIYGNFEQCIDWMAWDRCGGCVDSCYPACGTQAEDTYTWFPSIDLCEWDPDWYDCDDIGLIHNCLIDERDEDFPNIGKTWYQHVVEEHYPRGMPFVGNYCRDGVQDFDETSVDCGGRCSLFCE